MCRPNFKTRFWLPHPEARRYNPLHNGNLQSQVITAPTTVPTSPLLNTQTYVYDGVNRLSNFKENGTLLQGYSYDSPGVGYGNRWISSGSFTPYSTQTPQSNLFTNNQWAAGSTATYGLAGNQMSISLGTSGTRSFTYDAENRQITASIPGISAISYAYDGEGRRVQKKVGTTVTTYVYDAAGNLAAEYDVPSDAIGGTSFLTADHLGSTRLVTKSDGTPIAHYDYAPFGEELPSGLDGRVSTSPQFYAMSQYPTGTPDGVDQKFTGKERDPETGLDFFQARYLSSAQGRFTSPDEFTERPTDPPFGQLTAKLGPLWFADVKNPQSLHKYAYVLNNPLKYTDPDGHCAFGIDTLVCAALVSIGGADLFGKIVDWKEAKDEAESVGDYYKYLVERAQAACESASPQCGPLVEALQRVQAAALKRGQKLVEVSLVIPGTSSGGPLPTSQDDLAAAGAQTTITIVFGALSEPKKKPTVPAEEPRKKNPSSPEDHCLKKRDGTCAN